MADIRQRPPGIRVRQLRAQATNLAAAAKTCRDQDLSLSRPASKR
jgi:hypothetical protein